MRSESLPELLREVRSCACCELPLGARPVLSASTTARLLIVGQAPGRKVHKSGVPWNDASGDRLRGWLELPRQRFYAPRTIAIIPVGFCYPGRGASGDRPPRKECASRWHPRLRACLPNVRLTLLVGGYAQALYLGDARKSTLTDTVRAWREYLPEGVVPLPHPSPRNGAWFLHNPWFDRDLLPEVRAQIRFLDV